MELGMIGLGRMGTNMVRRLLRAGHQCVVYDLQPEAVQALVKEGAVGTTSLEDFANKLKKPRAAWMMVPAAVVDPTLKTLIPLLERDDVVIDGGNSYYHDDIRRAAELRPKGIHYKEFVGDQRELYLVEEQPGAESPYERLLGDAMAGDGALFTREDAVEAAWAVVEPVLKTHHRTRPYESGSWGPKEADDLIAADGCWHNPKLKEAAG